MNAFSDNEPSRDTLVDMPAPSRTRYHVAPTSRQCAADRRRSDHELRHALAQDQLALHFQPCFSFRDGRQTGAEALIRWPHRRRGLLHPSEFLPSARRSSLITRIGGWALRTACATAADWAEPDGTPYSVTVNVASRQLLEGVLVDQVVEALDLSGLEAGRLRLDFTEEALLDLDTDMLLAMSDLRDLGVGVVLDEFGSGHASLNVLRRVPLTGIKLDRGLVRDVPHFREEAHAVRGICAIGHALGLTVAACGIETEAQRTFLAEIGCEEGQGYLLGAPAPDPRRAETGGRPEMRLVDDRIPHHRPVLAEAA